jgi:hypothetical protein
MAQKTILVPITNVYADGDYTGAIYVGSQKKLANVLLDTGSSTLAVQETTYNPSNDPDAQITDLLQEVSYEDKSGWVGAVVKTDVAIGQGAAAIVLPKINTAIAYIESKSMFGKYDGILGLAYTKLNDAYLMPGNTFPPNHNYTQVQNSRKTFIDPYFTQLEGSGIIANKFAWYTLRSEVNLSSPNPANDPLNNGFMIIGGGEDYTNLYSGSFMDVRVLHDQYYDTNMKAIIVGDKPPINVPQPRKRSGNLTNSVIDSGTNSMFLDQDLFNGIVENMEKGSDRSLVHAMRSGYMPVDRFNPADWPTITFVLEGNAGTTVNLKMTPENYWQVHSPEKGYASLAMEGDNGSLGGQSILGLPLMNNYFMIFDRSADKGLGVIRCASIKRPA